MDRNTRLVRCDELLEADVNGEIVALHVERGQCYGLNSVASEIWRMLAEPSSASEICEALRKEYDVDSSTCEAQVHNLLTDLLQDGLVREVTN
jgi:DNA-directed RNA polymerase delta subunit